MDSALRRLDREAEHLGDLLIGESLQVAQHEWRPLLGGKRSNRGQQGSTQLAVGLGGGRHLDELDRDRRDPPATLQRDVDCDPVEPGRDCRIAAERVEVSPDLHEDVLSGLLDVSFVVEYPRENGANATLEAMDELAERVEIAVTRRGAEGGIVEGHSGMVRIVPGTTRIREDMHLLTATCHETGAALSDYLEGDLSGLRRLRVVRHLARCEKCRRVLDSLTRTVERIRSLEPLPPSPVIVDDVVERIRRELR